VSRASFIILCMTDHVERVSGKQSLFTYVASVRTHGQIGSDRMTVCGKGLLAYENSAP
jgi:hypothetical protein